MDKKNIADFIDILDSQVSKKIKVKVSSHKDNIELIPLSFKQQKSLISPSVDGISGIMTFIKNLNDVILTNSNKDDLKIYDRIPIVLALRKELSSKKIVKDDVEIDIDDLIKNYKKFDLKEDQEIITDDYKIILKIPSLKYENKKLSMCIEDLKKVDNDNIGKNLSLILSYEIPKFIDSIHFNDNIIKMDELSISDEKKIMDNLPANVTNQITDYILSVRNYDEELLTINGLTVDLDSSLFE